jgi:hypothetical protein
MKHRIREQARSHIEFVAACGHKKTPLISRWAAFFIAL